MVVEFFEENGYTLVDENTRKQVVHMGYLDDPEIVMAAVSNCPVVLEFVNPKFQGDREIVTAGVQTHGAALWHACESLRRDRELTLMAVKNGLSLYFVHTNLQGDREIALETIQRDPMDYMYVKGDLASDVDIAIAALSQNGTLLGDCSDAIKDNREAVIAAVSNSGIAILHASDKLRKEIGVIMPALCQNPTAIRNTGGGWQHDFPEVALFGWVLGHEAFDEIYKVLPHDIPGGNLRENAKYYFENAYRFRAFTMSQHRRLGEKCFARCLDDNLVCMIRDAMIPHRHMIMLREMLGALPPGREVPRF